MAGGRLAVGTGNATGFYIHAGVSVEFGCDIGQCLAIIIDTDMILHTITIASGTKDGDRSSIKRVLDEVIAVALESFNGDEETSLVYVARVILNSGDLDIRVAIKLRTVNLSYEFT